MGVSCLRHPAGPSLRRLAAALLLAAVASTPARAQLDTPPGACNRWVFADVVAIDQVFFWNRLGAVQPQGMMFALRHDVVSTNPATTALQSGQVQLRPGKRPRPLVLRMNVGDCLYVDFQNLLAPTREDDEQPATRWASMHAVGMQLIYSRIEGSFVGANPNGLVNVGGYATYVFYAAREGEHTLFSMGTSTGGQGDGGQINSGLFGAIIVEPEGARWYRSQVTRADLALATTGTVGGFPIIDYEAYYPAGHPLADRPILRIQDDFGTIHHSDLTAIITGPEGDWFEPSAFPLNQNTYPQRYQPFREFTIIYHDEIGAVQAFPHFEQDQWEHTLHSGRDAFAINYGTGGIGAEVIANRLGVGPMHDCVDCKFEEFFLTSWAVGDPAMVVDVPANSPCMVSTSSPNGVDQVAGFETKVSGLRAGTTCTPQGGAKATKAFFPDDPSNVYHGYLGDHTRFRVLHAGSKEHHIHHLHAHQWLFTADSDKSTYLDSQALGPGSSFTAEIAYHGGGNLNRTPGDSIFHCHFYPHFAQGMWALWRVHDVLELGTQLNAETGRPAAGSRALPDGEIAAGTPIPAVVPLPGKPMAPLPGATVSISSGQVQVAGAGNPGFPFFVPGIAGHRPPQPPLDTLDDGGLPRHVVEDGTVVSVMTPLDFSKDNPTLDVRFLPEAGTAVEQAAMAFHAVAAGHATRTPAGAAATFPVNGRPAIAGAPIADPCPAEAPLRLYKSADIQMDVKFNKKGWHFNQQRFSALWEDVDDFLAGTRPPEPLFFRANSRDCIEFRFTNLVPAYYEQDDFQVRTPTDVLGQHIHLVKFDVLASDGAANGFNYEDGSLSPEDVVARIAAIRAWNGCANGAISANCPVAEAHPFFGSGPGGDWLGAQTTIQRWYADPIRDNAGNDRTLRTVFTHDHFGPSTHQQAGLYAGLVIEKTGSTWKHNETGTVLGGRHDGGPTTWQAVIEGPEVFREFLLEFGDFQLAYWGEQSVNPPGKEGILLSENNDLLRRRCPDGTTGPCPELVSAADVGTMVLNYRNEPLALRVRNPATNSQAAGEAGDLSLAFSSDVARADAALNVQPGFYPALTADLKPKDPYTPLLRAYENDRVQIRILVGGHEEGHNFNIHGIKWLFEPSLPNSGYRNSQMMGISEHYEFVVPQLIKNPSGAFVDRLYSAGSSTDDLWNGLWGIFRAYTGTRQDLVALSTNPNGRAYLTPATVGDFDFSCPKAAPVRTLDVTAVTAQRALPGGVLVYNSRTDGSFGPLFDPTAILYFRTSDLAPDSTGVLKVKPNVPIEPLILRARAGECIHLTLRNALPESLLERDGYNTLPMIVDGFNANDIKPSNRVGLHPQLLYYDVSRYDGADVGANASGFGLRQTVAPGQSITYKWYAGDILINSSGTVSSSGIEFGATNLISSDRIEHASKGAIGALIIEPQNATWTEDCVYPSPTGNPLPGCTRAAARVTNPAPLTSQDAQFREFVTLFQNDINMRIGEAPTGSPVRNLGGEDDPEDSGQKAINYRTEPLWKRMQHAAQTPFSDTDDFTDWWDVVSNGKVGDPPNPLPTALPGDPVTPVFLAEAGEPIRFRLLQPGGHSRNIVFALHGHVWDKEPYVSESTRIGRNGFSFWEGARMGHGPTNHFDAVIREGAGGEFSMEADYLFRDLVGTGFDNGLWGILRVE